MKQPTRSKKAATSKKPTRKRAGVKKPAAVRYPRAVNPSKVGKYPAIVNAGGGFVWDELLEYRVWCHPADGAPAHAGDDDYYRSFDSFAKAMTFHRRTPGAEEPIALILQKHYIDEPEAGRFVHRKKKRMAEWPVEFLTRPRRTDRTIPDFLSPNAPANRLEIIRGEAKAPKPAARKR